VTVFDRLTLKENAMATMTWEDLGESIARLSEADKKKPVVVFPPEACPATEAVPVTELQVVFHKDSRTNIVRLLTGKNPE
jgi:hypothetical protein